MSREAVFLSRWEADKVFYDAWGQEIVERVKIAVSEFINPEPIEIFLKATSKIRLKDGQKLVEKAFYRNKGYSDPYGDITDKAGTRFIVLLGSDVRKVVTAIESIEGWTRSKDRDYEEEQKENPLAFDYAAVHFIVRPKSNIQRGDILIPAGTPCEVQIKTLLQHAYSELTHDTIYKPQIKATPLMQRNAAKAMALLEATNDYFEEVAAEVTSALNAVREITSQLSVVYRDVTGVDARPSVLEGLLLEAYEGAAGADYVAKARKLISEKPFLAERIKERVSASNPLFAQPSILLAYLEIARSGERAVDNWPLTVPEMEPLLNDLGQSAN